MIGLYVHVPFCVKKCRYCDFPSYSGVESYIDAYVDAVCREISLFPRREQADTVYFGGGTPSLLRAGQIGSIMKCLEARFDIADDAEITLEANPDSVSRQYIRELAALGVNRVSLGIQSFDDGMLRFLGRVHTADEGKRAVQAVWDGGVSNISIDLMYGLPGQTEEMVCADMEELASLPVCHASIYSLIVEEHTPLWDDLRNGRCLLPNDEETAQMGQAVHRAMHRLGFSHYEISSYAKDGRLSRHNCKYWQYEPYVGFGPSAHSFYHDERWANIANIPLYIRRAGREDTAAERIAIDRSRAVEDYCFLALRMRKGIDYADFQRRFRCSVEDEFADALHRLLAQKLLEKTPVGCRMTALGRDYGNYVFSQFIRE